ncbi:hypothetical protein [Caulobacter sp.]|uniref:hypothetical protein n=1 Tax=Caulobacter sp. TaxID=78 RepID=UPI001B093872|nr:hypothetical protein [Caulobacter sp.]MBO9544875.1 hypothetical protein [Caulobacter sp.]
MACINAREGQTLAQPPTLERKIFAFSRSCQFSTTINPRCLKPPHTSGHEQITPRNTATWFRLSDASWAEIAAEYRNGATAAELARKWKVSPTSIYQHACKDGWTKKACSDAVARAHAEAEADIRALTPASREAQHASDASAEALPLSTAPADLRDAAMVRLAEAIKDGRDHEALRLTTLADRLARLTAPEPPSTTALAGATSEGFDDERAKLLMTGFVDWRPTKAAVEHETDLMFRSIYLVALAMLLKPDKVPALFKRRVMRFRRDYLGEDDAEALEAAERTTAYALKALDIPFMDFNGPEPKPARKIPARTWPPSRPPAATCRTGRPPAFPVTSCKLWIAGYAELL